MKKILSLTLAALMVVSMVPTAFAADVDYQNGTEVEYTGSRTTVNADGTETHNAEYTITVPALLAPGGSGTVTLQGMWPSDATVKVTAEDKVEMVNNINSADKKTLAVTFTAIELAGNNTVAVSDDETVSVADISNALFGTWAGKFNYNVEYNGEAGGSGTVTPTPDPEQPGDGGSEVVTGEAGATFVDGVTLSWDEMLLAENAQEYGYKVEDISGTTIAQRAFYSQPDAKQLVSIRIPDGITSIGSNAFTYLDTLTNITIPSSVTSIGGQAFMDTGLTTINYTGTTEQWNSITFGESWKTRMPATEVICSDGTVTLS